MTKLTPLFAIPLLSLSTAFAAPIEVKDTQGRPITIELTALNGSNVTFTTSGKEHTLTLDRFDDSSQTKIKEAAKTIPAVVPKLDIDVSVNNKRQKVGWYQATQTVSQKIILKNMSVSAPYPASKGFLVSVGHNRQYTERYKVMATTEFEFTIAPNKTFEETTKSFSTTYDAENKGAGNVGGYEYDSYVLVIMDSDGTIRATKTMDGNLKSQLDKDTSLAKRVVELKKGQIIDKNLTPTEASNNDD